MNVLVLSLGFALFLVPAMGGSYRRLQQVRFAMEWLVPVGLVVQVSLPVVLNHLWNADPRIAEFTAWMAGSALLLGVCVLNARNVGFSLAGLGLTLNGVVIALNGGMPIAPSAMSELGVVTRSEQMAALTPLYRLQASDSVLAVLGDVLPLPGPPLIQSVVSLGDMVLMVGVILVVLDGALALPTGLPMAGRFRTK